MLCLNPVMFTTKLLPCGQCTNCRINKQRTWSARIQLEAYFHAQSIFVTLTYDEDNVPLKDGDEVLSKRDLQLFVKRLRKAYSTHNSKFRFFAVGEYGSETQRPHYHLVIYGMGINAEPLINEKWGKGFTQVSELTPERCSYVAQYTIKKMNQPDSRGLYGRPPEFASMSTRPGIGYPAVNWLYHAAKQKRNLETIMEAGDVWNSVRIGGKIWPLGLYLRRKLRSKLGLSNNSEERQIQLENFDPSTGEIFESEPLPENFAPHADIIEISSPWRNYHEKKAGIAEIPKLNKKAEHRARSKKRRASQKAVERV